MAAFCSKNKETVAELFAGFFHFYAFEFNYRTDLITIAAHIDASPEGRNSTRASKAAKAAQNGWNPSTTKIAIQDPFESTFNVGHVVRNYGLQVSFLFVPLHLRESCSQFDSLPLTSLIDCAHGSSASTARWFARRASSRPARRTRLLSAQRQRLLLRVRARLRRGGTFSPRSSRQRRSWSIGAATRTAAAEAATVDTAARTAAAAAGTARTAAAGADTAATARTTTLAAEAVRTRRGEACACTTTTSSSARRTLSPFEWTARRA
jgi:hypothetical protein